MRKLWLMGLICLAGCQASPTEIVYEEGTYIKGDTLPYGFYYSEDPSCVITGYLADYVINQYIAEGIARSTFFTVDSFRDGDRTYYMVQLDHTHSSEVTLGHEPFYTPEDNPKHTDVCTFKKLQLN